MPPVPARLALLLVAGSCATLGQGPSSAGQLHRDAARFRSAALLDEFADAVTGREALLEVFEGHEVRLLEALEDRYGLEHGSWPPQKAVAPGSDDPAARRTEESSCPPQQPAALQQPAGFSGGLRWLFGAPVYVADIDGVAEANTALSGVIKRQFEELDGKGWLADRTYKGNNGGALDSLLEPADRNDEFFNWQQAVSPLT